MTASRRRGEGTVERGEKNGIGREGKKKG